MGGAARTVMGSIPSLSGVASNVYPSATFLDGAASGSMADRVPPQARQK